MRCPDCCKFVGLETDEPQEESFEIDTEGNITGTFAVDRNCADCGTTLKQAQFEVEDTLPDEVLKEHTNEDGKDEPHDLSIELDGAEVDESGGGRYARNVFKVVAQYTVHCACDKEFEHDGELTSGGVAASEFEECV